MGVNKKEVGLKIKEFRINQGYTLREFGEFFGASDSIVSRWEKGVALPNKERLAKISKLMGISVTELLGKEDKKMSVCTKITTVTGEYFVDGDPIEVYKKIKEARDTKNLAVILEEVSANEYYTSSKGNLFLMIDKIVSFTGKGWGDFK